MPALVITELLGDGIGPELRESVHGVAGSLPLEIDFERFAELRDRMPVDWPCVAESGVQAPEDAARVAALGYRLALVGTGLMRRADPARALRELQEAGRKPLP